MSWRVIVHEGAQEDRDVAIVDDFGNQIAKITAGADTKAVARLLAAAPELLSACREARKFVKVGPARDLLRAALAKVII